MLDRLNVTRSRLGVLLPVLYMAAIYWLSSIPGEANPDEPMSAAALLELVPPQLQNLLHIPLFAGLAWLWCRSLEAWTQAALPIMALAFTLATGYGMFDEWHQLHVPGRYASATDILLNLSGSVIAVWLYHRMQKVSTD